MKTLSQYIAEDSARSHELSIKELGTKSGWDSRYAEGESSTRWNDIFLNKVDIDIHMDGKWINRGWSFAARGHKDGQFGYPIVLMNQKIRDHVFTITEKNGTEHQWDEVRKFITKGEGEPSDPIQIEFVKVEDGDQSAAYGKVNKMVLDNPKVFWVNQIIGRGDAIESYEVWSLK